MQPYRIGAASAPAAASRTLRLEKRSLFRLDRPAGHRIECISGSIWITHDGDTRDLIIEAGHSHVGDRRAPLLAQALEAAELRVIAPPDRPLAGQRLRAFGTFSIFSTILQRPWRLHGPACPAPARALPER